MRPGTVWLFIIGVALVAVCVYLWRQASLYSGQWMHVSTVDEDGNQIGKGKWHRSPKSDTINSNGLGHVPQYVARLVNSPATRCSLIISSPDGNKAFSIIRDGSQLTVWEKVRLGSSSRVKKGYKGHDLPPEAPEPEKEVALRKLFTELGIAPEMDFVHDYNGYADAVRELSYPLVNEVSQATRITQRLLREVYHVQEAEGLDFLFQEH